MDVYIFLPSKLVSNIITYIDGPSKFKYKLRNLPSFLRFSVLNLPHHPNLLLQASQTPKQPQTSRAASQHPHSDVGEEVPPARL